MAVPQNSNAARRIELDSKIRLELGRLGKEGSPEQLREFYNNHAKDYDEMSELAHYDKKGCHALVKAFSESVSNKDARILDVAAGSGLVGKELCRFGYTNIDALEPAKKMLDIAKSQKIYKAYIMDTIQPNKKSTIGNGTYDAICIGGAVLKGHVTLDCLPELMRITKNGGVIVFNIADKYLRSDPNFQDVKMAKRFQAFVDNGQWIKWDELRAVYRYKEDCSIFRITLA